MTDQQTEQTQQSSGDARELKLKITTSDDSTYETKPFPYTEFGKGTVDQLVSEALFRTNNAKKIDLMTVDTDEVLKSVEVTSQNAELVNSTFADAGASGSSSSQMV